MYVPKQSILCDELEVNIYFRWDLETNVFNTLVSEQKGLMQHSRIEYR